MSASTVWAWIPGELSESWSFVGGRCMAGWTFVVGQKFDRLGYGGWIFVASFDERVVEVRLEGLVALDVCARQEHCG